jgi:hypothetical protein
MGRFLPAEFQVRERILSGLAVALAGVALYLVSTAVPRAAPMVWLQWQFLGTVLFVAVSTRDRAFFTGLYCTLLSGALAVWASVVSVVRMPWPPDWASWPSELSALIFGAFVLILSIAIPIAFAWCVSRLIHYLELQFTR